MSSQRHTISDLRIRTLIREQLSKSLPDPIVSFVSQILNKPVNDIVLIQEDDPEYIWAVKLFKRTSRSQYIKLQNSDLNNVGTYCLGTVNRQEVVMTNISGYCVFYM